jgi:L-aspartate oxidase
VRVATGGAGQCFAVTTNPALSTGDGIAMAMRAGAAVADLEFMQFHPTALHHPSMPRPLLSEALRGEGAILRDEHGIAFMRDEHPLADLAPRDVVAKAISRRCIERDLDHMWLDATAIGRFPERFPTIAASVRSIGLDPSKDWLPIAPAAHHLSGGVLTDLDGATALPGLWAVGEVADVGVHGANRLASNSLLEGMVFGPRTIDAIERGKDAPEASGALRAVLGGGDIPGVPVGGEAVAPPVVEARPEDLRDALQQAMTLGAGVVRTAGSLELARTSLAVPAGDSPAVHEVRNLATVGDALVRAALARTESRGNHWRSDHPEPVESLRVRLVHTHP